VHSILPEALGTKLDMIEDQIAVPIDPRIKRPEDLDEVKPIDPYKDGRLPVVLKTISLLHDKIGDIYPILGHLSGPICGSFAFRGAKEFYSDLKKRPEFAAKLLNFVADQIITFGKAQLDFGAVGIHMTDASGCIESPKQYEEMYFPVRAKIVKALGHLTPPGVLWTSETNFERMPNSTDFIERILRHIGTAVIHVATPWALELDLHAIRDLCRQYNAVLWLGIEAAAFSNLGTQELEDLIKDYLKKYASGYEGNFQMGPNMLNETSKPELVHTYVKTMRTYGKCPVQI
jgi:uroporphyrinogen-III decarboxylase